MARKITMTGQVNQSVAETFEAFVRSQSAQGLVACRVISKVFSICSALQDGVCRRWFPNTAFPKVSVRQCSIFRSLPFHPLLRRDFIRWWHSISPIIQSSVCPWERVRKSIRSDYSCLEGFACRSKYSRC